MLNTIEDRISLSILQIMLYKRYTWNIKGRLREIKNGILLCHEKEWNWGTWRDVNGLRVCHTGCSNSEREKQIIY